MFVWNYLQMMYENMEGNKTGFLSVGVDSFDQLFLYTRPMSFPMVENGNKIENMMN